MVYIWGELIIVIDSRIRPVNPTEAQDYLGRSSFSNSLQIIKSQAAVDKVARSSSTGSDIILYPYPKLSEWIR